MMEPGALLSCSELETSPLRRTFGRSDGLPLSVKIREDSKSTVPSLQYVISRIRWDSSVSNLLSTISASFSEVRDF